MRKGFIVDTNILLNDPDAIFNFADNDVIIPIYVIEEIDTFKKDMSELGAAARKVCRTLDKLRETGSLSEGVKLPGGGTLVIALEGIDVPGIMDKSKADGRIL